MKKVNQNYLKYAGKVRWSKHKTPPAKLRPLTELLLKGFCFPLPLSEKEKAEYKKLEQQWQESIAEILDIDW